MGVKMTPRYLCANPMTLIPALALGFALGVRHATDADHIAAIGTFIASRRSALRAASIGAMWGVGHSFAVLVAGGALVMLRMPMPVRLALALELLVALMLIGLGVRSIWARHRDTPSSAVRPLLVGMVHGLAGSAVLALVVIGSTSSVLTAAAYLACFGIGTVVGMALVTILLALPAHLSAGRALSVERSIRLASGVASVIIGVLIAHRVGVQDGLFAAGVLPLDR